MPRSVFRLYSTGLSGPVAFGVGLPLLALAPLIRGGNRQIALMLLQGLALILLIMLFSTLGKEMGARPDDDASRQRQLPPSVVVLALSPLWVGLSQLVPVPWSLWVRLPGHAVYAEALAAVQVQVSEWLPLSLIPDATWISVFAGLPIMAVFLLALCVSHSQLGTLTKALAISAFVQSVIGLLQVSLFKGLYFDALAYERAIGSFANPNHFAAFLGMTLPLTIYHLRLTLNSSRGATGRRSLYTALWGVVLFVQLAGLLASLSRAGLAVGVLVSLLAILLLPMQEPDPRQRWWRFMGAAALCVLVVATVGFQGFASRVSDLGSESSRAQMFMGASQGALAFWPFGSGLGTFAGVFPRFQPSGLAGFAEHAHSDYVQLLMECGLVFVALAALTVRLSVIQSAGLSSRLEKNPKDRMALLQASCGFGFLAVVLHSWVDFNLRIPAIAMTAAFLFGAFLRSGSTTDQKAWKGLGSA